MSLKCRYIFSLIMALLILCFGASAAFAAAETPVQLAVNGQLIEGDSSAYAAEGRTMVPIRFVTESLGAIVNWDGATQTADIYCGSVCLSLQPGSYNAHVNGIAVPMETAAVAREGRIFVPIRFVAELFNATVNWDAATGIVDIVVSGEKSMRLVGYYYDRDSFASYETWADEYDCLTHFNFSLTEDGHVAARRLAVSDRYNEIKTAMKMAGQDSVMLITGFYGYIVDAIVTDPEKRATAIADILSIMDEQGYNGVDLDIESMGSDSKEALVMFAVELKEALGDRLLTMSLAPQTADTQFWYDKYDYTALANVCDYINLMFYNQHYSGSSPGPNCSIEWLNTGIEFLSMYIPPEKMIIGLGCYGYDWRSSEVDSGCSSVRITTALDRAAQYGAEILRDEASGVPYFSYYKLITDDASAGADGYVTEQREITFTDKKGNQYTELHDVAVPVGHEGEAGIYEYHEVWFEDAESLAQKAAMVRGYQLAGIALWRMGFLPDEVMDAIVTQLK